MGNYDGMPGTNVVCLYSIGEFTALSEEIKSYFEARGGYDVRVKTSVTIDDLFQLPRCSVLFFNTHGGHDTCADGSWSYFMATDTPDTPENVSKYRAQCGENCIVQLASDKLGITEKFVETYWNFEPDSFVLLHSCYAANEKCTGFNDIMNKKCAVWGGWTWGSTGTDSDLAAKYLFDRLLGANRFIEQGYKMEPPQRPFDWVSLKNFMAGKLDSTWDRDDNCYSKMVLKATGNGDFGLLAPSIKFLEIDEKECTLTLHGLFGSDQSKMKAYVKQGRSGDISMDDYELAIETSTDSKTIVCKDLPKGGRGSSGHVVVAVDYGGGKLVQSNPVPITSWKSTFNYSIRKPGEDTDSEIGNITYKAFLRGDIHKSRKNPEEAVKPRPCVFGMVLDPDNRAQYTSGGSYTGGKNMYKYIWSGSGSMPPGDTQNGKGTVVIFGWYQLPPNPECPKLLVNMFTGYNEALISIYDKDGKTIGENLTNPINLAYLANETNTRDQFFLDFIRSSVRWENSYDIPGKDLCRPINYPMAGGADKAFSARLNWEDMRAQDPPDQNTPG